MPAAASHSFGWHMHFSHHFHHQQEHRQEHLISVYLTTEVEKGHLFIETDHHKNDTISEIYFVCFGLCPAFY